MLHNRNCALGSLPYGRCRSNRSWPDSPTDFLLFCIRVWFGKCVREISADRSDHLLGPFALDATVAELDDGIVADLAGGFPDCVAILVQHWLCWRTGPAARAIPVDADVGH